jgi:hypothetical protein
MQLKKDQIKMAVKNSYRYLHQNPSIASLASEEIKPARIFFRHVFLHLEVRVFCPSTSSQDTGPINNFGRILNDLHPRCPTAF